MENQYSGTKVTPLPDNMDRLIRAGIALFECRVPYQYFFDKVVMGPYNCVVEEFVDPGRPPRLTVNWITGINAGIKYWADIKTGNCIAWVPDDPWMHNRVVLLANPSLNPVMRHSPREGLVPRSVIGLELQAIKNMLFSDLLIFKVMKNGREIDFFYDEKEAKDFVEDKRNVALKMDANSGTMKAVAQNKTKYDIEKGSKLEFKPEIKELIRQYQGLQYGWTSCEEFSKKWRPLIARELTKLKADATPARAVAGTLKPADMVNAMSSWTPEERTKFREAMAAMISETPAAPPAQGAQISSASVAKLKKEVVVE